MERVVFLIEETNEQIRCLLNPESLVIQRTAGVQPRQSIGGQLTGSGLSDDPLLYTGGGRMEIHLDLLFDVTLAGSSIATDNVRALTAPFWALAENSTQKGYNRPPQVRFLWGKEWDIPGIVVAVAEHLEQFTPAGAAQRSWLRMRLVRVNEPSFPVESTRSPAPSPAAFAAANLDNVPEESVQVHAVIGGGVETVAAGPAAVTAGASQAASASTASSATASSATVPPGSQALLVDGIGTTADAAEPVVDAKDPGNADAIDADAIDADATDAGIEPVADASVGGQAGTTPPNPEQETTARPAFEPKPGDQDDQDDTVDADGLIQSGGATESGTGVSPTPPFDAADRAASVETLEPLQALAEAAEAQEPPPEGPSVSMADADTTDLAVDETQTLSEGEALSEGETLSEEETLALATDEALSQDEALSDDALTLGETSADGKATISEEDAASIVQRSSEEEPEEEPEDVSMTVALTCPETTAEPGAEQPLPEAGVPGEESTPSASSIPSPQTTTATLSTESDPPSQTSTATDASASEPVQSSETVAGTEGAPAEGAPAGHEIDSSFIIIGERLDQLAFRYYGDPRYWRLLAIYNNIDNPMQVPSNLSLRIPPESVVFAK